MDDGGFLRRETAWDRLPPVCQTCGDDLNGSEIEDDHGREFCSDDCCDSYPERLTIKLLSE